MQCIHDRTLREAICHGETVPLEYRWKHMEQQLAFCRRGCFLNGSLPRCLAIMWNAQERRQAQEEANLLNWDDLAPRGEAVDQGERSASVL